MSEPVATDVPTTRSIIEGSLAQILGGALATTIVTGMASYGHYMQAGFESSFGTLIGVVGYIAFKSLRAR